MEEKENTHSFDLTIEEINSILSKNPKENKISYERLLPVVEEKRHQFISRIEAKRIDETVKAEVKKDLKENPSKEST